MFNSPTNTSILSTLAAALLATGLTLTPAMAGDGGGADRAKTVKANAQSRSESEASAPIIKIDVPVMYENIFFPGPMPGGRGGER